MLSDPPSIANISSTGPRPCLRQQTRPLFVWWAQELEGYFEDTVNYNRGVMVLDVYQPSMSLTVRKEIDPLQWTEISGNIGGFLGKCSARQVRSPSSGLIGYFFFTLFL